MRRLLLSALIVCLMAACEKPKEEIVLRQVKDVVADASSEPMLKAQAVFYNPNDIRMRLKKIKVDVIIDGKKRAEIDQNLNTLIPAKGEFTVPLEVKLAMKEMGFLTTVMSMISGKRMEIHYVGSLKISYHGVPIRVPVDYKSEIRIKI